MRNFRLALFCSFFLIPSILFPETGREAWLRYEPLNPAARANYASLPAGVTVLGDSPVLGSAREEIIRGVRGMLGRTLRVERDLPRESTILLGDVQAIRKIAPALAIPKLGTDGFWLTAAAIQGVRRIVITSPGDRGVLYGAFALLGKIEREQSIAALNEVREPDVRIRWVDQWDNLNGTIERGYGGPSIFFENDNVRADLTRVGEYGRLLASIGVQGVMVNNVNANLRVVQDEFLPQLARIAGALRPWGVRMGVAVDLSSPQKIGGLDTFDPLDSRVSEWWRARAEEIYKRIPDFGGFIVKADSEGRLGPSSYGRTPADAANMLARALKPHGGILFYRAFVYDHNLDWRNPKNDRARAAYDIFQPLDGKFDDNVVIQIKHGPIDFQVREPVSPLFGGLQKTASAIELPVMLEYMGQQEHVCYLMPSWKEILDFDMQVKGPATPVKDLISGKTFGRAGGFVAVVNVGMDENWLGHPMGMANLYGFGRLAWDPDLSAESIASDWTRLTFGKDPVVVQTVAKMLMSSWRAYENYTGPLGAQTLTDITGAHFGPRVEASERNGWGQWHRADENGIGMDRSVATGTGFAGQYASAVAKVYESLGTTPDNLTLWFHHVPYTHKLKSGKTVIQHIYDSHYEGAEQAEGYVTEWEKLRGRIDHRRYAEIMAKLEFQAGHARVWRDSVCGYFNKISGIPDAAGRVGKYPERTEAESMQLSGYTPVDVVPWENSSGGKGIECAVKSGCSAAFRYAGAAGWRTMDVEYYDQNNGESKFRVLVNDQPVDEWVADNRLPARKPGGDSSSRRRIRGLALRPGDEIRIEGVPDGQEPAGLDFVSIK